MLTFGESVAVAIISAVVAFFVSLVFRWLDRERPVWRVTSDGHASASSSDGPLWLEVKVTNIGNGFAYDAALMNAAQSYGMPLAQPVLAPGESLYGLVHIPAKKRHVDFDKMGMYPNLFLAGPELRGLTLHLQYRRPPVYLIRRNRRFRLASLASRARKQRNDQRERAALLRTQQARLEK